METQTKIVESLVEVLDDLDARDIRGVQRYRAMNQYLSMKARYKDVPMSGTFELTPLCNLNCKMCYVHLNNDQLPAGKGFLNVEEWKDILRQAVDAGMMYAAFTGGECLTYPGFRELYLYAYSLGVQPDVMTNGCLLTEEMISFFSMYPPGIIQISLYGSSEDAYEAVTGCRSFQQALSGIQRAKAAGLNLTIAVTPNRFMQPDIPALLALLHSLDLPYEIGSATLYARPETERRFETYAVEIDAYMQLLSQDKAHWEDHRGKAITKTIPRYLPPENGKLQGLPCGGAHSSFHINWKGELCPCIAFATSVHCSVLEQGFVAAWNQIRQEMAAYRPPNECTECELRPYCVTCPGEKSMGNLQGGLNRYVCEKLKRNMAERCISTDEMIPNEVVQC